MIFRFFKIKDKFNDISLTNLKLYKKESEEKLKNNYSIAIITSSGGKKVINELVPVEKSKISSNSKETERAVYCIAREFKNLVSLLTRNAYQFNFLALRIKPYVLVDKLYCINYSGKELDAEELIQHTNHNFAVIDIEINKDYSGFISSNDFKEKTTMSDVDPKADYYNSFINAECIYFESIVDIDKFFNVINELGYQVISFSNPEYEITAANFVDMLINNDVYDINMCADLREKEKEKKLV